MRVVVVGAGYVGLVSASCLSDFGADVVCVEANGERLTELRNGRIPFHEPGIASLVKRNVEAGRLAFEESMETSVGNADVVFIAVGTPMGRRDGMPDLSDVKTVSRQIAQALTLKQRTVVAMKSTVPVSTARMVEEIIAEERPDMEPGKHFDVASNPEFLREGTAIEDFMKPDRVVLGVNSDHAKDVLCRLYQTLSLREVPIVIANRETSELAKYVTNSFLAMKITYVNEIADLCEAMGTDITAVTKILGMDRRIGPLFLHPGPGYGGSCLPKDTVALKHMANDAGAPAAIVSAAIDSNQRRREAIADRVESAFGGDIANKRIAVLGLTYKPDTDDMREAASLVAVPSLVAMGVNVVAYDPVGMNNAGGMPEFERVAFASSATEAIAGSEAVLILTEWREFRGISPEEYRKAMAGRVIVDMRNLYNPHAMKQAGLEYWCCGSAPVEGGKAE